MRRNKMKYDELNVFIKYCSNRVNYDKFLELMLPRYNDENYIDSLWPMFRENPAMFIISRNETKLFEGIQKELIDTNYKG
jgi:uncharacterized membrane protein YvbJ